ncbi:hypothetical protein SERLA73DRAFT_155594 [Serpula lacrymans var. lacrymans S7.3]|uniref:Uncharacterized protein n=1 Tax=Serpula lacrymans var. lacrymans (strain S7.3) TaxID=936435 RepID=F8QA04_SERL3|nr:hypothetical protein SERLA73DRAFT_155594 [Serpula lacrymans var. lacrymans S7.3]
MACGWITNTTKQGDHDGSQSLISSDELTDAFVDPQSNGIINIRVELKVWFASMFGRNDVTGSLPVKPLEHCLTVIKEENTSLSISDAGLVVTTDTPPNHLLWVYGDWVVSSGCLIVSEPITHPMDNAYESCKLLPTMMMSHSHNIAQDDLNPPHTVTSNQPAIPDVLPSMSPQVYWLTRNDFGFVRQYNYVVPLQNPDYMQSTSCASYYGNSSSGPSKPENPYHPYPNSSSFLLGDWYWNYGNMKTQEDFVRLCNIITLPDFLPADVAEASWLKINNLLADVSAVSEQLSDPQVSSHYYFTPYELKWQPEGLEETCVHGELYTSPAFLKAYQDLQDSPQEPGCNLERCILGLMFSSDATQLTTFSNVKLWPLYMYIGNESKYRWCKPNNKSCDHIAYFQVLPDSFKNFTTT